MGLFNCMECFPKLCRCPEKHAWETIGERKANQMLEQGMEPIGAVLLDPKTGKRATVDIYGRVQWWEVDGAGALVPNAGGKPPSVSEGRVD